MTNTIEIKHFHDASPTWNGFNHQGKVALLIALDIIKMNANICMSELKQYELELEWLEDVAVLRSNEYISIHQVKAYKTDNISKYADAIWALLGKSYIFEVKEIYLHSVLPLSINCSELGGLKLSDNVEKYKQKILKENSLDKVYKNLKMYHYKDNNYYCELEEIESLVKRKISDIIKANKAPNTTPQVDNAYLNLLNIIDKNVKKRHAKIQRNEVGQNDQSRIDIDRIQFDEILQAILYNYEEGSEIYYRLQLKHIYSSYVDEFLVQLYEDQVSNEIIESFKIVANHIASLEDLDFYQFCKKISPDCRVQDLNSITYHTLLPKEGVYDSFFSILTKIRKHKEEYEHGVRYKLDNKIYVPTAINSNQGQAKRIARGILKNENMLDALFLVDTIISERMNIESIGKLAQKVNEISAEEMNEGNFDLESKKITRVKNIRMIDIEKAREELEK
ncbi:ABC-three component system protein [Lysinibacillus xylanilyticus]|uniref:ABC-three component system protein n=1 Tax=Lysinibacillus xylanilyticus TaxID=582475 RepID=UPI003CFBD047